MSRLRDLRRKARAISSSIIPSRPSRLSFTGGGVPRLPFPPNRSVRRKRIVGIAVQPPLARLGGGDNRMAARPRVLRGVAIRRRIAAERGAAALTRAQVHPVRPALDAFV